MASSTEHTAQVPGFRLLGPLGITDGEDVVVLAPSKPTTLLAALLLHPNAVVSTGYLLRAVWGEDQPATAKAALHTCMMRLRRVFASRAIVHTGIEAVPGGYRIAVDAETLDLIRFRSLLRAADAQPDREAELTTLKRALSLWDGPVLGNVSSTALHGNEVRRIVEERLRATERIFDIELSAGRCRDVLSELWLVARSHPGHERFAAQLIEALYRTGRQADAIAEYHRVKRYLRSQLAVDPGPGLRRLELDILSGNDLGPVVPMRSKPGPATVPADPPRVSPPGVAQRVGGVAHFVGRKSYEIAIRARLADQSQAATPVVLSGAPGIGKTALALHVARAAAEDFPGGSFVVPMRHPDGTPRTPDDVCADLPLAAFSVDRRALFVLDDAVSADQVRPVLERVVASTLVTSQLSLAGLVATNGGWVYRLDGLEEEESRALLESILGPERVVAEPSAVRTLCAACGHFPLALKIIATRLVTRPRLRIHECVEWLRSGGLARWSVVDDPRLSIPKVFGNALARLGPNLADVFVVVGGHPRHPISVSDCAALLGLPLAAAEKALDRLVDASLVDEGPPGLYHMPAPLRAFARGLARQTDRWASEDRSPVVAAAF